MLKQNVIYYSSIDSTNEEAKRQARAGAAEGTVIVAEEQKQGKGRLGRKWFSPSSQGLWFSIILRPPIKPAEAAQLTFVSAVAVCKALRSLTGLPIMIKWPNDLLYGMRKVCGILTETVAEREKIDFLVVGIGINVNQEEPDFLPELRDTAGSLAIAAGHTWSRTEILKIVLQEFERQYLNYLENGFTPVLQLWRELNMTLGEEVVVTTKEDCFTGLAEEIDEHGCLLVRRDSGEVEALLVGDVSIRKKVKI